MSHSRIFFLVLITCIVISSCRRFEQEKVVARAEPFVPTNLYPIERLPNYFNRVVVLPCYYPDEDSQLLTFVDEIFHQELAQERIFETVRIDSDQLNEKFGKKRVSSTGVLPENFLRRLEEMSDANGVLFVDLDSYRPYDHWHLELGQS